MGILRKYEINNCKEEFVQYLKKQGYCIYPVNKLVEEYIKQYALADNVKVVVGFAFVSAGMEVKIQLFSDGIEGKGFLIPNSVFENNIEDFIDHIDSYLDEETLLDISSYN